MSYAMDAHEISQAYDDVYVEQATDDGSQWHVYDDVAGDQDPLRTVDGEVLDLIVDEGLADVYHVENGEPWMSDDFAMS